MLKRKAILVTLLLVFASFYIAAAQDINPIAYGDSVGGKISDPDNGVLYSFEGREGEQVTIQASSDAIDVYLRLGDYKGNILAEHDDISKDNTDAQIDFTLTQSGTHYIAVLGYAAGPYTLSLSAAGGGTITPVSEPGQGSGSYNGQINDKAPFYEIPLGNVAQGSTIKVDVQATSGDLDPYLAIFSGDEVVAENDDRPQDDVNPALEYTVEQAGEYTIVVSRYGFQEGKTSGDFEANVQVTGVTTVVNDPGTTVVVNPEDSGYPVVNKQEIADWTILTYYGGDNNLEQGLLVDMNEFEMAGGSSDNVNVLVLMDRVKGFDKSNGNWTDSRIFYMGPNTSADEITSITPTVDTVELANLGEIDTSDGNKLTEFLVWGIQNYPARHYAISLNDHGGAWLGTVWDDTTGSRDGLTLNELSQSFQTALEITGVEKFDFLVNDSCLMSSVEHYAAIAPYFRYAVGSPEITYNPSFDMSLLLATLKADPDIELGQLGQLLADKYVEDMFNLIPDNQPLLGAVVTDFSNFDRVIQAVEQFAGVVNENPDAYASVFGEIRSNVYAYSFFMPEDQYGYPTNIDLGDFMNWVLNSVRNDEPLRQAAQEIIDALDGTRVYGTAGKHLRNWTSYYNVYFPARSKDFKASYLEQSSLVGWATMLQNYYNAVSVTTRAFNAPVGAPSLIPQVSITNVYPSVVNVNNPVSVSMEVIGRNISRGTFTVDQVQPDGSSFRLTAAGIVRTVVVNGQTQQVNQWDSGINDNNFTWEVTLPLVTDGVNSNFELVTLHEVTASLSGRYRFSPTEDWLDVSVMFDAEGYAEMVISGEGSGMGYAPIILQPGGEFQVYRSVVTPDGRVELQPGNLYVWPEGGLRWQYAPAPDGQYNLGFLIEAMGGVTGFDSVTVTVSNQQADETLRGYLNTILGFTFQRPADWFGVEYFPNTLFFQTNNREYTEYILVYSLYKNGSNAQEIAEEILGQYELTLDSEFTPIKVAGLDAVEIRFHYTIKGQGDFIGRAFAVYREDQGLGLLFSAETVSQEATDRIYQLLLDHTRFFSPNEVEADDTGEWDYDFNWGVKDEMVIVSPVRLDWMGSMEVDGWLMYAPGQDQNSTSFAKVTTRPGDDAATVLNTLLKEEVTNLPGYMPLGTEIYYGENFTWEAAYFAHEDADGDLVTGRMYVTVQDGVAYAWWFEAPSSEFDLLFLNVFTVMLDGFELMPFQS